MASRENLYADLLFFVKNDLSTNITDPIVGSRSTKSSWVMTSYPHRQAQYPLITVKIANLEASRAGLQTDRMDINIAFEVRVWSKSQAQRDQLTQAIIDRLADIQFTSSGSIDNDFHDFGITNALDVDEPEIKLFSKVIGVRYRFYNA